MKRTAIAIKTGLIPGLVALIVLASCKSQDQMTRAQIAGNKKEMVDSLINSTTGDTLCLTLRRMYEAGAVFATSYAEKDQYRAMREPDSSKLWLQKYFEGNTPKQALTTLEKFQN